jgi:post-segregation antitoxin (ccd killing protein)
MQDAVVAHLFPKVQEEFLRNLREQPIIRVASVDWIEAVVRRVLKSLGQAMLDAWTMGLESVAREVGSLCPACEKTRKCKKRLKNPMKIRLLGFFVNVPKLYFECGRCGAPGLSVTKLLTGLCDGGTSSELKLSAAYLAAEHSYGKASRDLDVHHGQTIDRTHVRRMALEVEQEAMVFAETERRRTLSVAGNEGLPEGVELLMLQGDGGSVRTGKLVPCEPGDSGFGKTTPNSGRPRRKRMSQNREVITLDIRQPGQSTSIGLDVVVPCQSQEGERARRMLSLALRQGLGQKTQMIGLGDMGSSLPAAFEEAFVGQEFSFYSTDWKHICDYVRAASTVLEGVELKRWRKQMRDAIWKRNVRRRDELLNQAYECRVDSLPAHLAKCPLDALATYLSNNWQYMQAARLKELGLDYVSARAEAQVRERTKSRFCVAGAWREENLEPKATLRSIIAEGRWGCFREHYLNSQSTQFRRDLQERLDDARGQKRVVLTTTGTPIDESQDKAA